MRYNTLNIALLALCSLVSLSCVKEMAGSIEVKKGPITFHAYDAESNDQTKTTLSGTSVLWNPGDQIMVYQGTTSSGKFTSTATETCSVTDFTGTLPYIIGGQESSPKASNIWAVYPYSAACGCDGNSVTVKIDAEQTAQEGTFASGIFPSVAKSNSYSLAFYNVCGGVKFTVAQSGIQKVIFRGNASENLAGKVNVSFSGGLPIVGSTTEAVDNIIVNAPSSDGFTPGKEYFIVTIPSQLSDGYKMTFVNQYDQVNYSSKSSAEIKRKTFGILQEKDKVGILFKDSKAKAACVEKFDTNNNGYVSFDEAQVPTTLSGLFEKHIDIEYFSELQYFTSVQDLIGCFRYCSNLKEFYIPFSVTVIGTEAFLGCTSLKRINIPSTVISIGDNAFQDCTSLYDITIDEGVKTLGPRSFSNIGALSIALPASVTNIGKRAFGEGIKKITIQRTSPPMIADPSFATSTVIYVPNEALSSYRNAENWSEIEDQIKPISEYYINDLSQNNTANCYIVSTAGEYKFNANVKGNSSESIGNPFSAKVLWESFGTNEKPEVGDLVKNVLYRDGYILFYSSDTHMNGNAVIAVTDKKDNILWSWHIWLCSNYDPLTSSHTYNNNAGIVMDRNLGATSSTPGDVQALGLLYQWGRKDPFLGASSIGSSDNLALSSTEWPDFINSDETTGTIPYIIAHPMAFIKADKDWLFQAEDKVDEYRWAYNENSKTIYDPCPVGWKVPKKNLWSTAGVGSISYGGPWDLTANGMNFENMLGPYSPIWYPAAGYYDSSLCSVGGTGAYWSCTRYSSDDDSYPSSYQIYTGRAAFHARYGHEGYSVRCVKE